MTFYQELQLNQAGSKNLLKKSETLKEKLYHMWAVSYTHLKTNIHFDVSFLTAKVVITTHQNSSFLQIYQNAACITCESYCVPRTVFRLTEERTLYAFSTHP